MNTAVMSRAFYSVTSYWASINLQQVKEDFGISRSMMVKQNNLMLLAHQGPLERSMLMLVGTNEQDIPGYQDLGNISPHTSMILMFNKMYQW